MGTERKSGKKLTPAMQQFMDIKSKHPDCILFFRMGDFYETFFDDAVTTARELEITLTKRGRTPENKDIPLAGIPYHALHTYLYRLTKKGFKVAIVEQLEDPKKAKGLVKRGLVRIVTPGTVLEENGARELHTYVMAVGEYRGVFGIALADISTGDFLVFEVKEFSSVIDRVLKFRPQEIIAPTHLKDKLDSHAQETSSYIFGFSDDAFTYPSAYQEIVAHFSPEKTKECEPLGAGVCGAGALLRYLKETQKTSLDYMSDLKVLYEKEHMVLDSTTLRNLEIFSRIRDGSFQGTLFSVLDETTTRMGARLLSDWFLTPLVSLQAITARHDAVGHFMNDVLLRDDVRNELKHMNDIHRLIAKCAFGSANARDGVALRTSLEHVPRVTSLLKNTTSLLNECASLPDVSDLVALLSKAIKDEPSATLTDGNLIKSGYSPKVDELREVASHSKRWLSELEQSEKEKTGIKSLKIRYNRVFGYFIEVTKSNLHLVPDHYVRKQTQVNSERFITPELKEKEATILNAEERLVTLEAELFRQVIERIVDRTKDVQTIATSIAQIDCLLSLAHVAVTRNFTRPTMHEGYDLSIKDGRHPVIETIEHSFVPNDTLLSDSSRMMIITGPNMAGKSTYMRQVALIVILAHVGSFVPAQQARIGIVDRVFTRVGASDDLYSGQSTFMVEMKETANIVANATDKSLIILDEIGRGTSTFDGVALAWSIAEFIADRISSKTLFATHYHVLNKLAEQKKGIVNYNILVKEHEDSIIFLRKIAQGGTDKSYGVHVAKLAGMPSEIITRAKEIQLMLEDDDTMHERIIVEKKRVETPNETIIDMMKVKQRTLGDY